MFQSVHFALCMSPIKHACLGPIAMLKGKHTTSTVITMCLTAHDSIKGSQMYYMLHQRTYCSAMIRIEHKNFES